MADLRFSVCEPFAPRPVVAAGVLSIAEWKLKSYGIAYSGPASAVEDPSWLEGIVACSLPRPASADGRPGVGWVILHRGRGMDYVVLGWWDRENELPVRVWVREDGDDAWRPAQGSESFCVWDLQIMGHERDAYVHHVLTDGAGDLEGYLGDVVS